MKIESNTSIYSAQELQRLLGLQKSGGASKTGQNMPSSASEAKPSGPPPGPPPPRPAEGASDQFAAETLSSLLSAQESARPTGEDIAARLIGKADSDSDGVLSADEISSAITGAGGSIDGSTLTSAIAGLDSDADGDLSLEELGSAIDRRMSELAANRPPPPSPQEMASSLIEDLDGNGDGSLGLEEIASAISSSVTDAEAGQDALSQALNTLDANGDGVLSAEELTHAIEQSFAQMAANTAYRMTQDDTTSTSTRAEAA